MLSYQHHYHAGNHADILKHWLLLECITHIQSKERGFDYIDTHAGAGCYSLNSIWAQKTAEYHSGVMRFLESPQAVAALPEFAQLLQSYIAKREYPGSPECARAVMRPQDRCWLFELHPQTFEAISTFAKRKSIFVRNEDGFAALPGLLPPASKRALVLIDPSYEVKTDYLTVINVVAAAYHKMPQAMFLIWYPRVNNQERLSAMLHKLETSNIKDVLQVEMGVSEATDGMYASGMLLVNPPWHLKAKAESILPIVSAALADDKTPRWTCRILKGE